MRNSIQVTSNGHTFKVVSGDIVQIDQEWHNNGALSVLIAEYDKVLTTLESLRSGLTVEVSRKVWERDQARLGELEQENARLRKALEISAGLAKEDVDPGRTDNGGTHVG